MTITSEVVTKDDFEEGLNRALAKVTNSEHGLFGPSSMMWRLARHALIGAHGSGRALLLQIAHPWVTQGIAEHSATRHDPLGRAVRTFTAVISIVYGNVQQAVRQARIVRAVHDNVEGVVKTDSGMFAKGSRYQANEAHAMLWVHATLWDTSVVMHELFYGPLSSYEKEKFYEETKLFAFMFGIPEGVIPPTWQDFVEYNRMMWDSDQLFVNAETRDLAKFLFDPLHPILSPAMAWLKMITAETLSDRLRSDFALEKPNPTVLKAGIGMVRSAQIILPPVIRFGPSYVEATRRVSGKHSTRMTRKITKTLFGKEELVALSRQQK
ncbi:hypothetical protein A9Q99_21345 [Gammaproteobacteria bacterium 45_16_T64]|nr:hypothetical protein A9Q99_21345 [Gammaproteobacteria bacterium 45_16_T64]